MPQYRMGGLLRCCLEAIPDRDGQQGEHIPCEYCRDPKHSGVVWNDGAWEAAWITLGHSPPPAAPAEEK